MAFPKIPTGPLALALNGFFIDGALKSFARQYLPAYELEITSAYRNAVENEEVGGVEHSAHLYNLARDFVLLEKNTGRYISKDKLKKVYNEFIRPNWDGYSEFNEPRTGETGWVHVNIDREITNKTKFADYAAAGVSIALGVAKIIGKLHYGRNRKA